MNNFVVFSRHELRESTEAPGFPWVFVAEIRCDGSTGNLWRRRVVATLAVCVKCGHNYMWVDQTDECPHCEVDSGI